MSLSPLEAALEDVTRRLHALGRPFALVGGLAVSFRAEVRFTRDVDLAVVVEDDADFEALIFELRSAGYIAVATVENTQRSRLATARLASPLGFIVDLIASTCGIEREIVERATPIQINSGSVLPVARAEELLAMKVLSMSDRRLQDRIDARNLVLYTADLDLGAVRDNVSRIITRGFHRGEDLQAKLAAVLSEAAREA
jgi:hypothetical protein